MNAGSSKKLQIKKKQPSPFQSTRGRGRPHSNRSIFRFKKDSSDKVMSSSDSSDQKSENCDDNQDITEICDDNQGDQTHDITDNCDQTEEITDNCDQTLKIEELSEKQEDGDTPENNIEMAKDKINKLIKETIKKLGYLKYDLKIQEISSGGANYTSNLYKVHVVPEVAKEGAKEGPKLFVKIACPSVNFRRTLKEWKIYSTEEFFYTKLVKTFRTLEDENRIKGQHKLSFCKFYGCSSVVYEEMLALEDLTASNWMVYDRFKSITWPYAKAAVAELAKFHSLSFAYKKKDPKEFKQVLERLKTQMNDESLTNFAKSSTKIALQSVNPDHKELLKEYFDDFETKVKRATEPINHTVIGHGDFRPSNLMHKIREDGSYDIRIVDLQTLQGVCPVADLIYFIFTGSDEEFRSLHYDKLLDHYYKELEAALKRLRLDPEEVYSRIDFDCELKQKLPYGLTVAVFALPVVTVSVEDAPKVDSNMELSAFTADKGSDLYVERLNGVVNDFIKWELFEDIE